ncbi:MAG: threonine synthase [Blautia sp.]|nr:threonine synthase [Blautia sp.]
MSNNSVSGSSAGIMYTSTRGGQEPVTASMAILKGLSDNGGLFVPTRIPRLEKSLSELAGLSYQDLAYEVMRLYLTDFSEEELRACIRAAYDEKFDTPDIASLHEADGAWFLELYHGATIAFKDMALSILPHLMTTAARKNKADHEIVILTATSGDTGKAALAGFADVPGTRIVVFYPKYGVSPIQEKQMVTQKGANTCVIGITGNFDDAQTAVKKMFADREMGAVLDKAGFRFSSANSINIGRLVPQIVYYVYAYARLLRDGVIREGEEINITVPTGNFGNILAAYYAKQMGLPVKKLICASNENKVLFDFFTSGTYDRRREFILTSSPSMDILISSNLERLIYKIAGEDAEACAAFMASLSSDGSYTITEEMKKGLTDFYGNFLDEEETACVIADIYAADRYVIDPHTAVGAGVRRKYVEETGDDATKTVIASTASPYKFTRSVMRALGEPVEGLDDFVLADRLQEKSGVPIPEAVRSILTAPVLHDQVVDPADMPAAVLRFLGI